MSTGREAPGAAPLELAEMLRVRGQTLRLVAGLSQGETDRRPARGRWSVGEILDHLVLMDEVYRREIGELVALRRAGRRPHLRRGFAELDVAIPGVPRALMPLAELPFAFFNLWVPRGLRGLLARSRWLPARNPAATEPRPGRPAAGLRQDLTLSAEAIERLLFDNRDLDFRELTYYHPVLGWCDVPCLLRFVADHEQRHQAQIGEALARCGCRGDDGGHDA